MKIVIEYCGVWNYRPQAARLAAAIEREAGRRAELVEGGGGVFTLSIDGRVLFEKRKAGRFPTEDEVVGFVRRWAEAGGTGWGEDREINIVIHRAIHR